MNPTLTFVVLVAIITAFVLWIVLRPLLTRRIDVKEGALDTNVQALRIELSEARRDRT